MTAQHVGNGDLALAVRGVSEHRFAVHIARSIDARHACLTIFIGDDGAAFHGNADGFEPDTGGTRAASDGDKHLVRRDGFRFAVLFIGDGAVSDRRYLCAEDKFNAFFLIIAKQNFGDFAVGRSRNVVEHLDDRDLYADRIEIGCHFKSDNAAADDDERAGKLAHVENLAIGHRKARFDGLFEPRNGRHERIRAGAEKKLLRLVFLAVRCDGKALRVATRNGSECGNHLDAGFFQPAADAGDERSDDLILASDDEGVVDGGTGAGDAIGLSVLGIIVNFRAVKQRLGRDAALIEAYAAERFSLEKQGFHAAVGCALRRIVAGGTASQND